MADTNVQITLSADSKQIRNEIKLIDKELRELGGQPTTAPKKGKRTPEETQSTGTSSRSSKSDPQQESRDKIFQQLSREASLIRKELQSINQNKGAGGQTPSSPTPPASNSSIPQPQVPSGTGGKGLGDLVGKLATLGVILKGLQSAWNYASSGAQSSATGESLAYKTYGSSLSYTDYYTAKKDAKNIGSPFGYNYDTVMESGNTNMSKAGFTTVENYTNDMTSILGTAKAWGLDTSQLSGTSGYMASIGVTESGEQKKFADMLAESIVSAEMTGREDEQLQVLENIADSLARTMVKVDDASLSNVMGLYTSLANNNETLKGQRGASIVDSLNSSIVGGGTTLDVLLGWGTDYTGVEGRVELDKLKEQGLTNPETLAKVFSNFEGMTGHGIDSDYGQMFLHSQMGMGLSYSQVEALLKSKDEIMSGKFDTSILDGDGSETADRLQNHDASDVSTQERNDIAKQDTKEVVGEGLNNLLAPFRNWYSGLGDGGRVAVDAIGGAAKIGVGVAGTKAAGKRLSSLWSKFKGTAGTTPGTPGAGSATDDVIDGVAQAAGNSADDAAKGVAGATNSVDDVLRGTAGVSDDVLRGITGSGDDVLKGLGAVSKVGGKALPIVGALIEAGITAYDASQAHERGDDREMSQEIGGGVGGIAGGLGGAAGGAAAGAAIGAFFGGVGAVPGAAIGGIIGGIGGGVGGNALGESAGEAIYGKGNYSAGWTQEQRDQVFKYYDEVKRLYEEEGNNAAQNYTKSYVTPYLNSIGVSTSYTDKYNTDVGKPDFMKHIEDGEFGLKIREDGTTSYRTANGAGGTFGVLEDALDENTSATEELTDSIKHSNGNLSSSSVGSFATQSNSDSLLTNDQKDVSEPGFQWWNPFSWGNSHAHGNDYVPYDDYKANLHKGEAVLSKFEADEYRQGKSKSGQTSMSGQLDLNINLSGDLGGMTSLNQNRIVDAVVSQLNSSEFQKMISNGFTRVQNY